MSMKFFMESESKEKKQKALVTSRILFISVLDKIYLVVLGLVFLLGSYNVFEGKISSLDYGFWGRVFNEVKFLAVLFIVYLLCNWLYKCAAKTMLCLTKNEVYKESYFPFKRSEKSIPIDKISSVTTVEVFWIFRSLIIHQYSKLPLLFFTWNSQEFKDKLNELLTNDKEKIENEYADRNIIAANMYKYLKYVGVALLGIICLLGIVRFFAYTFSPDKKIAGTYENGESSLVLKKNGKCELQLSSSTQVNCENWTYDRDAKEVTITYEYSSSYYFGSYERSVNFTYDSNEKTLIGSDGEYRLKK